MSESRDERIMQIVDEALDIDPALRPEFIRTACGSDAALIRAVEGLLACQDDAARIFDAGEREMRSLPSQVGPYRLLSVIGEGGMGVVWRAEQREPIKRIVAVKLIKLGMDTNAVIARFESERQALAMMDHPNVAKVFDAGATSTGRPYFVMEFVAGEAITTFCDRNDCTIQQRLELFMQACEAVQHAHQKTLIHRDLKPSNILVSQPEGQPPTVKVIDFGVAKATAQNLTERTLFTETGQLVGTPEYMSPEQADLTGLDVDTRSDVYSLGVVLYELISGALPFDAKTLRAAGFGEIQRIIREVDPPRPSTRLSSLGEGGKQIARKRQMQVEELTRQLRGELEWIPLKAMSKERNQRYSTATELAQDVANYLAQRPLTAGPESAAYRTRKFLKRNKGPVFAAMLVLFVLAAGILATSLALVSQHRARVEAERNRVEAETQRTTAERRREEAEAVASFLTNDVFEGARPERLPDKKVRDAIVTALIDPAAAVVHERFKDKEFLEAAVRHALAGTYDELGRTDLGIQQARISLEINRRRHGEDHPATLRSITMLGDMLRKQGKFAEAEPLLREALERFRRVLGNDNQSTITAISGVATLLQYQGKFAEAEPLCRETFDRYRRVMGDDDRDTLTSLNNLASVLLQQGKLTEAEPLFREALERNRRVFGDDNPLTIDVMNNLGFLLKAQGKLDEAEPLFREAVERARRVLGDDHPRTLNPMNNLAQLLRTRGNLAEAEPMLRQVLDGRRKVLTADHPDTIRSEMTLGNVLRTQGKLDEAEPLLRDAMERAPRAMGENHPNIAVIMNAWALLLEARGRFAEAEPIVKRVLEKMRTQLGPDKPETVTTAKEYVRVLEALDRRKEADEVRAQYHLAAETTRPTSQGNPTTR